MRISPFELALNDSQANFSDYRVWEIEEAFMRAKAMHDFPIAERLFQELESRDLEPERVDFHRGMLVGVACCVGDMEGACRYFQHLEGPHPELLPTDFLAIHLHQSCDGTVAFLQSAEEIARLGLQTPCGDTLLLLAELFLCYFPALGVLLGYSAAELTPTVTAGLLKEELAETVASLGLDTEEIENKLLRSQIVRFLEKSRN